MYILNLSFIILIGLDLFTFFMYSYGVRPINTLKGYNMLHTYIINTVATVLVAFIGFIIGKAYISNFITQG